MAEGTCLKVGDKEFCYSRKQKCPCSRKLRYSDHYKTEVGAGKTLGSWGKYLQTRQVKKGPTGLRLETYGRACEHHHIICVASVGNMLGVNAQIQSHAEGTNWCINEKRNLIGLPMWPLHLKHYCKFTSADPQVKVVTTEYSGVTVKHAAVDAPPFENLPMHDQDHDLYIDEIDAELRAVANDMALVEECQDPDQTLKARLDRISDKFKELLMTHGMRNGGTHRSWEAGINEPCGSWYLAFSMASAPRRLVHPILSTEHFTSRLEDYLEAFWLENFPIPL